MNGEMLKEFLVGLGFSVDEKSLSKFNDAIKTAATRVTLLYAAVKVAAAGILYGISKISEGFEQMGYEFRLIAPNINKVLLLRRELLKSYSLAGINIAKVVRESVLLNFSLTKTKYALEAIYKSVASRFFSYITKQSDLFRKQIYANMPKIQAALEKFVKFIFKALEATTALGMRLWSILGRVFDFFKKLHDATNGWSTIILGIAAAWQVLNLSFLASPLGMILTGLLAILALYDDFKTFQEGGQSFFNWSKAIPVITQITDVLSKLWNIVSGLVESMLLLAQMKPDQAFEKLKQSLQGLIPLLERVWDKMKDLATNFGANLKESFGDYLKMFGIGLPDKSGGASGSVPGAGGIQNASNIASNLQSNPVSSPLISPIGSQNVSSTNQSVNQQTTINVQGSADAQSTGKMVSSQQNRVNFDMVRNLRGATR